MYMLRNWNMCSSLEFGTYTQVLRDDGIEFVSPAGDRLKKPQSVRGKGKIPVRGGQFFRSLSLSCSPFPSHSVGWTGVPTPPKETWADTEATG